MKYSLCLLFVLLMSCQNLNRSGGESSVRSDIVLPPSFVKTPKLIQPGRYIGFLKNEGSLFKTPVVLDLIAQKNSGGTFGFEGVLKFSSESFGSNEYGSIHFKEISFDEDKNFLKGDSSLGVGVEGELSRGRLSLTLTDKKNKSTHAAELLYQYKYQEKFYIDVNSKIYPHLMVMPKVADKYYSMCKGKKTTLNISLNDHFQSTKSQGLDNAFQITGYRASARQGICPKGKRCIDDIYRSGSYSFLNGELSLAGMISTTNCKQEKQNLSCGCDYSRSFEPQEFVGYARRQKRQYQLKIKGDEKLALLPTVADIKGEYYGYLHHETNNKYQLFRMRLDGRERKTAKPELIIKSVATLFFGDKESNEFIAYRYTDKSYEKLSPYYIFDGPGENFLQVSLWTKNLIYGILYSKKFGRVGSVELVKNRLPGPPPGASVVSRISGRYSGEGFVLEALAQSQVSINQDIYPLDVAGNINISGESKRVSLDGAQYDFYRSEVDFFLSDGRIAKARFIEDGRVEMRIPSLARYGSIEPTVKPESLSIDPIKGSNPTANLPTDVPVVEDLSGEDWYYEKLY